jgi:hypothetical protein
LILLLPSLDHFLLIHLLPSLDHFDLILFFLRLITSTWLSSSVG